MSSIAPVNARHASLALYDGYPSVVCPLLGIGRSRKERGLVNTMGEATATPRSRCQSRPLPLPCGQWHVMLNTQNVASEFF